MNIRSLHSADSGRIREILASAGNFSVEEIAVAMELVDEALEQSDTTSYLIQVLEDASTVHGYICYGPTPLTQGTYDLYWIAVDQESQGKGFGQALIRFAEQDIVNRGGRLLLIETSSQQTYAATTRFYERAGYNLEARIRNFYRPGDDLLIFRKELV